MIAFHPTHINCYRFARRLRTSHQHLPRVFARGNLGFREGAKGATCSPVPSAYITANAHCCCRITSTFISNHLSTRCASLFQRRHAVHFVAAAAAHVEELGLVLLDPEEMLNVKDKSLKDMGKENFNMSELERLVTHFTFCFVMLARHHLSWH